MVSKPSFKGGGEDVVVSTMRGSDVGGGRLRDEREGEGRRKGREDVEERRRDDRRMKPGIEDAICV